MVITNDEAFQAMIEHHQSLVSGVKSRSFAIQSSLGTNESLAVRIIDLVNFMELEVIPHAKAEEHTIYQVAVTVLEAEQLIASMNKEHEELVSMTARLKELVDSGEIEEKESLKISSQIAIVFAEHAKSENDDILSRLVANTQVDLAAILKDMEQLFLAEKRNASHPSTIPVDREERLVSVILDLARELSRRDGRDYACKRVANTWSILKDERPSLAQSLTNALHSLSSGSVTDVLDASDSGDSSDGVEELDVRDMIPRDRHAAIFEAYYELHSGDGFVLVNDHDPKPLEYQFEAEHTGEFTWRCLESGPSVWKVRIGRI